MASLAPTFGRGAMTNHWVDIKNADLVLIMGGNAAEAHPCGFKWVIEAKAHNKAKLIVVDPRFTRSAAVADFYAPIRAGTDIAFLGGVINYLLTNDKIQHEYVKAYTDATLPRATRTSSFEDGLFSGYDAEKRKLRQVHLGLPARQGRLRQDRPDAAGSALRLPADEDSTTRATRRRWSSKITGTPKDQFLKVCEMIADDLGARPDHDDPVRAGLDAALAWARRSSARRPWCSCCWATSACRAAA